MILTDWNDRVAMVAARQADHARRIQIAGMGQPLDPLMWPIIHRFWALGIRTVGSCQGHAPKPDSDAISRTFVTVRGHDPLVQARWKRLVFEFLTPVISPGVLFGVTVLGFESSYPSVTSPEDFAQRLERALSLWVKKLDQVGQACLEQEPPWEAWDGPAADVPSAVDPQWMLNPFVDYLAQLDPLSNQIVRWHLNVFSWEDTAHYAGVSVDEAKARWDQAWAGWIDRQAARGVRPKVPPLLSMGQPLLAARNPQG